MLFMKRILLVGLLAVAHLPAFAETAARPNVLFIAVDDLRTNLGCYGDPIAITPNLDRLAKEGTLFERAYTQIAVCNPSRASLLTGCRPDTLGVWDLKTNFRKASPGRVTLPEYFKDNGYFTRSFGKIFHGGKGMTDPTSWSVPEELYVGRKSEYRNPRNQNPGKNDAMEFEDLPDDQYPDAWIAQAAIDFLKKDKSGEPPFFLAVGFRKPHLPFVAPKRYWDLYEKTSFSPVPQSEPPQKAPAIALHDSPEIRGYGDVPDSGPIEKKQIADLRRGYYAASSFVDAQIGRVLDALRETGLDKNTVIVFWSDHGYHLGEHNLWSKTTNYELDTHVPLIIAAPGRKQVGTRIPKPVELLDIYPTVVALCGLPAPAGLEGVSLAGVLDQPSLVPKDRAISQFARPWFYRGAPQAMGYSVRTDTHRYTEWRNFADGKVVARELYQYEDPRKELEKKNLADSPSYAETCRKLSSLLPPATGHTVPPSASAGSDEPATE